MVCSWQGALVADQRDLLESARDRAMASPNQDRDAIGIFDSGVGGLTVMHELIEALPSESFVYLGDTGRYPYGNKSPETVTRYSLENAAFLVDKGIKLLVVACNAASSVALGALRRSCRSLSSA